MFKLSLANTMLYNTFLTLFIAFISNTTQGCHSGLRKRSLTIRAQSMTSFFEKCLSDSAGKEFRWGAITRFAIDDTAWYDETNSRFCRGLRDTDECWRTQLDFFVNPYSRYSHHIKRCIREYASKGSRTSSHFVYDDSLQSARVGRWKRALFVQPWFHRRRFTRPWFVPPVQTTRTAVAPHYVPPRRVVPIPSQNGVKPPAPYHPVNQNTPPPVHNRIPLFQTNFRGPLPQQNTIPFESTRTPTARSQPSLPLTARAQFSDLSRYDQLYVSILQNLHQLDSTTRLPTQHTPSYAPFVNARECDQSSRSRFEGCVRTTVDDPAFSRKRSLMMAPDTDVLSKDDLQSIFQFFRESYSPCMDEQTNAPIKICSLAQVRSDSSSTLMCLPSVMVRLVRKDSDLRNLFLSCASRN